MLKHNPQKTVCRPLTLSGALLANLVIMAVPVVGQLSQLQHEPDLAWRTVTTEHFWIHYPGQYEALGRKVAAICEEIYEPVSRSLDYFPGPTHVVVQTRVDFPGGVVTFLPWRMELFVTEPQGNLSGSGDEWLRVVIAHEFTHIVHLRKRRAVSALTYPFLGDFNAFWQQMVPRWFTEGFATLNETRYSSGGAGRTPFHWMQMSATVRTDQPWPLENTSFSSRKRMPRTQMPYVAGYYLSHFIRQRYGPRTWIKILDRYSAFPFLGFGRAVKSVTGKKPKQLYRDLLKEFDPSPTAPGRSSFAPPVQLWRNTSEPENQYSPRWLDGHHLILYRRSLDDLRELAVIDRTGRRRRLMRRALAKVDNSFTVGDSLVVWAELHPHPRFSATIYSDLRIYDRRTGNVRTLTHNARVYSPDLSPDRSRVIAIQTAIPTSRLVAIDLKTGLVSTHLEIPRATLLNPRWSPDGQHVALALKDSTGQQNIIIFDVRTGRWRFLYRADAHHDNNPSWTADGQFVLYASDRGGIFNIWAVDVSTGRRWMVTDSNLGAFTPDVSPDGRELSFALYTSDGFRAATMSLDSARWLEESSFPPPGKRTPGVTTRSHEDHQIAGAVDAGGTHPGTIMKTTPYRPWSQILRPQGWIPYPFKDETGQAIAIFATSQDALHRHAWQGSLGLSPKNFRSSVNVSYTYRRWWPDLTIRTHSLPQKVTYQNKTGWWRKRGLDLTVSVPLVPESNVTTTFFHPLLGVRREVQARSTGPIFPTLHDYRGIRVGFSWARYSRAPRDIVPHIAWFVNTLMEWSSPTLGSEFHGSDVRSSLDIFLPTLIPHHQIEVLSQYERERGNFGYSFFGAVPKGYGDDGQVHQLRIRAAYIFPVAFVERSVPFLPAFVDYLDAAIFYDWGTSWDRSLNRRRRRRSERFSTGVQVTSLNYFFQRVTVRLGVAVFYLSESRDWKAVPVIELPF
ncbi:MAG: hypothetical protein ACE5GH_02030 [Fidelibacterota bacterium]